MRRRRKKGERSEPRDEDTAFGGTAGPKPATLGAGRIPRKQPLPRSQKALLCLIVLLTVALACSVLAAARCDTAASATQTTTLPDQPWGLPWATINAASVPAYATPAEAFPAVQHLGKGIAVEVKSLHGGWAEVLRWTSQHPLWVRVKYLDFAWGSAP